MCWAFGVVCWWIFGKTINRKTLQNPSLSGCCNRKWFISREIPLRQPRPFFNQRSTSPDVTKYNMWNIANWHIEGVFLWKLWKLWSVWLFWNGNIGDSQYLCRLHIPEPKARPTWGDWPGFQHPHPGSCRASILVCTHRHKDKMPGKEHCCVPVCNGNKLKFPDLSFHYIPKNKIKRKKWIWKIRLDVGKYFKVLNIERTCVSWGGLTGQVVPLTRGLWSKQITLVFINIRHILGTQYQTNKNINLSLIGLVLFHNTYLQRQYILCWSSHISPIF